MSAAKPSARDGAAVVVRYDVQPMVSACAPQRGHSTYYADLSAAHQRSISQMACATMPALGMRRGGAMPIC